MALCAEHGKVLPHYRCAESERYLDELEVRIRTGPATTDPAADDQPEENRMMTSAEIDPSTPEAEIDAFVAVIRGAFAEQATEQHGPMGGYQWLWSRRGLWKITAGAVLHPEPVLTGPAGEWRIARADHTGAVYALMVLAGADALPPGVEVPGRGGMYAAATAGGGREVRRVGNGPRPQYRQPGGNTGARPGSGFLGSPDRPVLAGPGAAYVPQQIDDGPAGTDLPSRGVDLPDLDTGEHDVPNG